MPSHLGNTASSTRVFLVDSFSIQAISSMKIKAAAKITADIADILMIFLFNYYARGSQLYLPTFRSPK